MLSGAGKEWKVNCRYSKFNLGHLLVVPSKTIQSESRPQVSNRCNRLYHSQDTRCHILSLASFSSQPPSRIGTDACNLPTQIKGRTTEVMNHAADYQQTCCGEDFQDRLVPIKQHFIFVVSQFNQYLQTHSCIQKGSSVFV